MATVSRRIDSLTDALPALQWVSEMVQRGLRGGPVVVTLGRETRSSESNRLMWSLLTDVAKQVTLGGQTLTPEDYKDVFSASLKKQRLVPDIDGNGFVALGARTSKFSKEDMGLMIDLIRAYGNQHGVTWTAPEEQNAHP